MKKISYILIATVILLTTSCDNETNSTKQNQDSTLLLARELGLLGLLEETETPDATFYVYSESTFDHVNSQIIDRTLNFSSTLNNQNIGNVFFNNVMLQSTSNYNKFYGLSELQQEELDIDNLFGNNVNFRNENCSNSALCNINFNFDMIHKIVPQQSTGFDLNYISKNNGFTLRWDKTNIKSDEIVGILILEAKQDAKPGDIIPSFAQVVPTNSSEIAIPSSELATFPNNAMLTIRLIKGKVNTNTLANGKTIKIVSLDILGYSAILK